MWPRYCRAAIAFGSLVLVTGGLGSVVLAGIGYSIAPAGTALACVPLKNSNSGSSMMLPTGPSMTRVESWIN